MREGACPKCGSADIVPNRPIRDLGHGNSVHELTTRVEERPDALIFKGETVESYLRAWVCGECGYTELYATDHRYLFDLYTRAQTP